MDKKSGRAFMLGSADNPPPHYDREPSYEKMKWDRDVMVSMRDGVHLCVDVYRPDAQGKFPALLAFGRHNKDLQTPEACEAYGPQPAWSPFWFGIQEVGDTRFFVSRGYVHVVGNPRGMGKSEDDPATPWGSPRGHGVLLIPTLMIL